MEYKEELTDILTTDTLVMETLAIVKELKLNDCWVGTGLIRNTVWDSLHQIKTTKRNDIDMVFFDATTLSETLEKEIETKLIQINPKAKWSPTLTAQILSCGTFYLTIKHASADVGLLFTAYNLRRIFNLINQNTLKKYLILLFSFFDAIRTHFKPFYNFFFVVKNNTIFLHQDKNCKLNQLYLRFN